MIVQLKQLFEAIPALNHLIGQPMPAVTAFRLAGVIEEANKHIERAREVVAGHDSPEAEAEALLNEDVELSDVVVRVGDLGSAQLSPAQAVALRWLVRMEDI